MAASGPSSGPVNGNRIGQIYISIDGGGHWDANRPDFKHWTSVTVSGDGNKVAVVDSGGTIHTATRVTDANGPELDLDETLDRSSRRSAEHNAGLGLQWLTRPTAAS